MPISWGYSKENGPATWAQHSLIQAAGKKQSPINIEPKEARFDKSLIDHPLEITYIPENSQQLLNNGLSVQVVIDGTGSRLTGGPLADEYEAVQFHFHWGSGNTWGSEHRIDGETFSAELHIVHFNKTKYSTFSEAASKDDGLSVLGVFMKVGEEHAGLKKIVDLLPQITEQNKSISLESGFNPASLLPDDKTRYWTYDGSLTTPPCYESIKWIVFHDPIEVSEQQLQALRMLRCGGGGGDSADQCKGHIVDNYRPPCALHGRIVHSSFRKFFS